MYKVIIWGTGSSYNKYFNSLKLQELMGSLQVLAVTSNDTDIRGTLDGFPFLAKEEVMALNFDFCLIAIEKINTIQNEIVQLGIPHEKIIPMRVLSIPYFNFDRYILLKQSNLTIFSSNCWAGICYHRMGLEFLSPTINLFFSLSDFNKFMQNLDYYLSLPVEFVEMRYENNLEQDYPVGIIGDIYLNFNHYTNFDYAKECWDIRKKRINYQNILVVSYTDSIEIAEEFDNLAFENKIIFTSFRNNLQSSFFINKDKSGHLWAPVIETANGNKNLFDMLSFLNHEKHWKRTY